MMSAILVPAKGGPTVKQRLSEGLTFQERATLFLAMFEDVLSAIAQMKTRLPVFVITGDPKVEAVARAHGAELIMEPPGASGESAAVFHGGQVLAAKGIDAMAVLPADMPGVLAQDLDALVSVGMSPPFVVMAPSKDGGSNGLFMAPPNVIPYHFGENSLVKHIQEARLARVSSSVVRLPSLELDIDTPSDLVEFVRHPSAIRTYAYLSQSGLLGKLSYGMEHTKL